MNRYFVSKCAEDNSPATWDVCDRQNESKAVSNHDSRSQARERVSDLESALWAKKERAYRRNVIRPIRKEMQDALAKFRVDHAAKLGLALLFALLGSGIAHAAPPVAPVCSLQSNPYGVLSKAEKQVSLNLVRDALATRDAIDDYLDKTPGAEVDVPVVRGMLASISDGLRCLRSRDMLAALALAARLRSWAGAVERELRVDDRLQSCIAYCMSAEPACEPEQCVVEDAS